LAGVSFFVGTFDDITLPRILAGDHSPGRYY